MIELINVKKSYGETLAVNELSLKIGEGQVVGFLGPNGAGKSTTMRMITGFLAPDAGSVTVNEKSVLENPAAVKSLIGYLPENNPLYEDMLVCDFLRFTQRLRGVPSNGEAIDLAVKQTGIESVFYRPIGELSKGFRQRVGLAQAILHQPEILILDEPTEGLDPNQRVEIRNLIKEIGSKRTVILSTHVLQEVRGTCDRVIIIDKGRLVADADIETLMTQARGAKRVIVELEGADPVKKLKSLEGVVGVDLGPAPGGGRRRLTLTAAGDVELRPRLFEMAKENDWTIWELFQEEISLEDVFRDLTLGQEDTGA